MRNLRLGSAFFLVLSLACAGLPAQDPCAALREEGGLRSVYAVDVEAMRREALDDVALELARLAAGEEARVRTLYAQRSVEVELPSAEAAERFASGAGLFLERCPYATAGPEGRRIRYEVCEEAWDVLATLAEEDLVDAVRRRLDEGDVQCATVSWGEERVVVEAVGERAREVRELLSRGGELKLAVEAPPAVRGAVVQALVARAKAGPDVTFEPGWRNERVLWAADRTTLEAFLGDNADVVPVEVSWAVGEEDGRWRAWFLSRKDVLPGTHVADARSGGEEFRRHVVVELDPAGAELFSDLSGAHVDERVAIVIDGEVESAPLIRERISGGSIQISLESGAVEDTGEELAAILRSGALGAPLVEESVEVFGPAAPKGRR